MATLNDTRGPFSSETFNITPDQSIWRRLIFPDGWAPDHTDWRFPSLVDVHHDGRMIVAADFLSNNYGSDLGDRRWVGFVAELQFKNGDQDIGTMFQLGLALVAPPNVGHDNFIQSPARQYYCPDLTLITRSTHFTVVQRIREASEGQPGQPGGGDPVNFPPINF